MSLGALGETCHHLRDTAASTAAIEEAVDLWRQLGSNEQAAHWLAKLAEFERASGKEDQAQEHLHAAAALARPPIPYGWVSEEKTAPWLSAASCCPAESSAVDPTPSLNFQLASSPACEPDSSDR